MAARLIRIVLMYLALAGLAGAAVPTLVTPFLPGATINAPYSAKLMVSSLTTGVVSASLANLPPGLSYTHDRGNFVISGTPIAAGVFPVTVTATNASGTLTVNSQLRVDQFAVNVVAIAASNHTCVVVNGGVQCWGGNGNGQLGNNSTGFSNVAVRAVTAGSNATGVAVGGAHTCAVVAGGLQCWGANGSGQLGNNSNTQSLVPVGIIAAGSNVTAVAAGGSHTCAVINGGVQCWGANSAGQLGNGGAANSAVPVTAITPSSGVTAIAAGNNHTCAVANGGVRCWGINTFGTLGNGLTANSAVPVTAIPVANGATAVALGANHSCAIVAGRVNCWGQNSVGQVGTFNASELSPAVINGNPGGAGTFALAAGTFHTCAALPDGVYCWGSNSTVQVGTNRFPYVNTPERTLASGAVTGVAAGGGHSCAIVGGGVQCWGSIGLLGTSSTNYTTAPVASIAAGTGTNLVDGGRDHTCASIPSNSVLCWGENNTGQLGNGSFSDSLVPVAAAIAAGSNGSSVGAWNSHSCAVVSAGVQCWGDNNFGQLGNGGNALARSPVVALPANSNISMVSTGDFHSCAMTFAGGVRCWGYNLYGQLGNGGNGNSSVPVVALPDGSGVTYLSARGMHTCAVMGGGVKCWGRNLSGQLGNNSAADSNIAVVAIAAGSGATTVSAGGNHSCAVVGGGVRCWGLNFFGQLGDNSTNSSPVPVAVLPTTSFASNISAGLEHSCAVTANGVQCWGRNHLGQLGNRGTTQSLVPVAAIAANSDVFAVTAGVEHSCATVSGGVVCWGNNDIGQLVDPASYPLRKVYAAIPLPNVPGAPFIFNNVTGPGIATLSFNVPASDGGLPITGYSATCTALNLSTRSGTAPAGATTILVTGMTGNVQYSCSMTATNGAGNSVASNIMTVVPGVAPLELLDVFSRKTHGTAGTRDLPLNRTVDITGAVTVEPRASGAGGSGHRIVFQFNNPVFQLGTVTVTDSVGAPIGSAALSPGNNEVIVTLTGIPDKRRVTVTLGNVNAPGESGGGAVAVGFLVGDATGDRLVNAGDAAAIKSRAGQAVSAANTRFDLNATGFIGAADIAAAKARSGFLIP